MKIYDTAVIVGRIQIPHKEHIELYQYAQSIAKQTLIVIGSVNSPRTTKNPFTFIERGNMLMDSIKHSWHDKSNTNEVIIRGIEDRRYNLNQWVTNLRTIINANSDGDCVLVGHHKDASSYYLDLFPEMGYAEFENVDDLNSSDIRDELFENRLVMDELPYGSKRFLQEFITSDEYKDTFEYLKEEYNFIKNYKEQWMNVPHSVIFNTVDAVVICMGHILLIERKHAPGRGLWALPGGFVNPNETLEDSMMRELWEETKIKVPKAVIRGNIKYRDVFDDPGRSARGRTITTAYLIELKEKSLPHVKGSDDAVNAFWKPLNEVFSSRVMMYEDHIDIIYKMTGGI